MHRLISKLLRLDGHCKKKLLAQTRIHLLFIRERYVSFNRGGGILTLRGGRTCIYPFQQKFKLDFRACSERGSNPPIPLLLNNNHSLSQKNVWAGKWGQKVFLLCNVWWGETFESPNTHIPLYIRYTPFVYTVLHMSSLSATWQHTPIIILPF